MNKKRKRKLLESIPKRQCRYCMATENLTYDHKIPLISGGRDHADNIQVLCKRCNGIKSALTHKQVMHLFKWAEDVRTSRIKAGKKPYGIKNI